MSEVSLIDIEKNNAEADVTSTEEAMNIAIKEHMQTIQDIRHQIDTELSTIDVNDYIENFLALHCGYVSENDQYSMDTWLEFAGGMYRPVNLTHKGKVIGQVPSLYPDGLYNLVSSEKETVDPDDKTVGNTLQQINQYAENYHEIGNAERKNYYDALVSRVDSDVINAHKEKWKEFFRFMGVIDKNVNSTETKKETQVNENKNNISNIFSSEDVF